MDATEGMLSHASDLVSGITRMDRRQQFVTEDEPSVCGFDAGRPDAFTATPEREIVDGMGQAQQIGQLGGNLLSPVLARARTPDLQQVAPIVHPEPVFFLVAELFGQLCGLVPEVDYRIHRPCHNLPAR